MTNSGKAPTELVVLDTGGTMIEDRGVVDRNVHTALQLAGLERPSAARLSGLRGQRKLDIFRALATEDGAVDAHRTFVDLMLRSVANGELPPRDGADRLLSRLHDTDVCVCLVSGFDQVVLDAIVNTTGWRPRVDLSLSSNDIVRGRPYPDLILTALMRCGIDSVRNVLVAGDTTNDLMAGTNAGAGLVVGVLGGAHDRKQLESAPHTHIVDDLDGIASLVGCPQDRQTPAGPRSAEVGA